MSSRHITLLELATYHLGTAPDEVRRQIGQHMAEGCTECREASEFAGRLAQVIQRDHQATPPEAVIARARAIFHQLPISRPASLVESVAELVFDSFREPIPAGLRAISLNRHLVFRHRTLVVDLQVEPESSTERQAITGQVQSKDLEAEQLEGLPVMLLDGEEVLMATRTTALGEFLFRDAPCRQLNLSLIGPEFVVRVPSIPPAAA